MKLQFRALFLFSILVALFGCHNKIEEELSKLLKHKIIIPYDQMPDTYSTAILEINKNAKYRLVVFVDSTECSSCSLRSLAEWETYIGEKAHKNLNLHIILQPKANEYNEIMDIVAESGVKIPVFVDSCYAFTRINPFIPHNTIMHTFLLNQNDSIVLVGNPLRNKKIEELVQKIILK